MAAAEDPTKHIVQSLFVNLTIATAKGVAAALTGSGAMLAETLHSGADCANQLLLLLGVRQAQRAPDAKHPLGYGRALYFWSFVVALLLFSGGGVFSVYEGLHKIRHPEPLDQVVVGLIVLALSLLLEGYATVSNVRELHRRRGRTPFFRFLRDTKDSDLVVVFGENAAASLGLVLAMAALTVAHVTGDSRWDGVGSLAIGVVLIGVAIFLGVEVKSLLVGESADPEIAASAHALAARQPHFKRLLEVITVQQGPGQVLFAAKVMLTEDITADQAVEEINTFEAALRVRHPEVLWSFVEPDVPDDDKLRQGFHEQVRALGSETPGIAAVTQVVSMRLSSDERVLGLKAAFAKRLPVERVEQVIDDLEGRIRQRFPAIRKIWVEPDADDEPPPSAL